MSRKSDLPQTRRHLFIYDEDWDWLQEHFGQGSASRMTVSQAVRKIIHGNVLHHRGKIAQAEDQIRQKHRQQQQAGDNQ